MLLTLSEAAYRGLKAQFTKPKHSLPPLRESTDSGIVLVYNHRSNTAEGVGHALNTFSQLSPTLFTDARPPTARRSHLLQLQYTDDCRVYWGYKPLPSDILFVEEDDTPWDSLSYDEQQLRLSMPQYRKQRSIALTVQSRSYYAALAISHSMETYSLTHGTTAYASAAIEAIGIGWLAAPAVEIPPNPNKWREGFDGANSYIATRGNRDHQAWAMTKERIAKTLQPFKSKSAPAVQEEPTV